MEKFLNEISSNPLVNTINFLITIISFILAFYFYRKSRQVKKFTYKIDSYNIASGFTNKPDGLQLFFKSKLIDNCTFTEIIFKNEGDVVINGSDVSQVEPLVIKIKEPYEILDAKIKEAKNYNQVSITKSENNKELHITFDFFDKKDYVVINFLHTGKNEESLFINGKIKGAGKVKNSEEKNFLTIIIILVLATLYCFTVLILLIFDIIGKTVSGILIIPVLIVFYGYIIKKFFKYRLKSKQYPAA